VIPLADVRWRHCSNMSLVMNSLTISRDNKVGGDYKWGLHKHKISRLGRCTAPLCMSREFRNIGPAALTPVNRICLPFNMKRLVRLGDDRGQQEVKGGHADRGESFVVRGTRVSVLLMLSSRVYMCQIYCDP
jgi:hypothetical protein